MAASPRERHRPPSKDELERLRRRVRELEEQAAKRSWRDNPDRMGGAFTDEEIRRQKEWR